MAMTHQADWNAGWNAGAGTYEHAVHHHHHHSPARSGGVAALLEFLPGFFFQIFGIGHIYAGNVGVGLAIMFGYWLIQLVNLLLCLLLIGFVLLPLTWILFLILSTIGASNAAGRR